MTKYLWKDVDSSCSYYYQMETGKIVGQVYNISHTKIYGSKLMNDNLLGHYISLEAAKKSIELYFDIENRTLLE